ncbi:unnamed protein product [Blepharisma stoltei]|uniref:Mitochondrial glycoprotein n=1 Tax=Blepharisma stoltei TaxID=1481888 RepID=A0AAU9IG40_9CILI|nr:unnamed protein product [Blepharisma stoltei]
MLVRQARMLTRPIFNSFRSFSSISHKRLAKALENELEYDHKIYKEEDEISSYMRNSGFKLFEREDHTLVTLQKKFNDAEVEITFHVKAPSVDEADEPGESQSNLEQDEPPGIYIDFQVLVKKPNTNTGFIFECLCLDQEITVANVVFSDNLANIKRQSTFGRKGGEYRGPQFVNLHKKVQNLLTEYLKDFGVDDNLAFFIEMYSIDKEHRCYMEWLRHVKNFVN